MRDPVWPCFGRERGPKSPNETHKRDLPGRLSDRSRWESLGNVGPSSRLITQRSLVQIQPLQPRRDKGLAVAAADPFVVSATILQPASAVTRTAPTWPFSPNTSGRASALPPR